MSTNNEPSGIQQKGRIIEESRETQGSQTQLSQGSQGAGGKEGGKVNDGGPAFPSNGEVTKYLHFEPGMSLRAYIATHALQGVIFSRRLNPESTAESAVAYADALIAELAKEAK